MTNHEAIETLKANYPDAYFEQLRGAVDTAIFALQRSTHKALDTISRQDAIDAIDALHDKPNAWLEYAVDAVKKLPSAQPEIIRCKDCKFYTAQDYTGKLMCKRIGKGMILPKPEDFCSYAERWEE